MVLPRLPGEEEKGGGPGGRGDPDSFGQTSRQAPLAEAPCQLCLGCLITFPAQSAGRCATGRNCRCCETGCRHQPRAEKAVIRDGSGPSLLRVPGARPADQLPHLCSALPPVLRRPGCCRSAKPGLVMLQMHKRGRRARDAARAAVSIATGHGAGQRHALHPVRPQPQQLAASAAGPKAQDKMLKGSLLIFAFFRRTRTVPDGGRG